MKIVRAMLLVALVFTLAACSTGEQAGETAQADNEVMIQGEPITLTETVEINEMLLHPDQYLDKTVAISGKVVGRCSGSGCWISIDRGEDKEPLIVQTADKSFIFDEKCLNSTVTIQGKLQLRDPYAAEEDAHEEAEADHVCPDPEYFFAPTGVRIEA